jgi:hypothetical protein
MAAHCEERGGAGGGVRVPAQPPSFTTPAERANAELAHVGLERIPNAGRGDCGPLAFSGCAQQKGGDLANLTHKQVRADVVEELRKFPGVYALGVMDMLKPAGVQGQDYVICNAKWEAYCTKMGADGTYFDSIEWAAARKCYTTMPVVFLKIALTHKGPRLTQCFFGEGGASAASELLKAAGEITADVIAALPKDTGIIFYTPGGGGHFEALRMCARVARAEAPAQAARKEEDEEGAGKMGEEEEVAEEEALEVEEEEEEEEEEDEQEEEEDEQEEEEDEQEEDLQQPKRPAPERAPQQQQLRAPQQQQLRAPQQQQLRAPQQQQLPAPQQQQLPAPQQQQLPAPQQQQQRPALQRRPAPQKKAPINAYAALFAGAQRARALAAGDEVPKVGGLKRGAGEMRAAETAEWSVTPAVQALLDAIPRLPTKRNSYSGEHAAASELRSFPLNCLKCMSYFLPSPPLPSPPLPFPPCSCCCA